MLPRCISSSHTILSHCTTPSLKWTRLNRHIHSVCTTVATKKLALLWKPPPPVTKAQWITTCTDIISRELLVALLHSARAGIKHCKQGRTKSQICFNCFFYVLLKFVSCVVQTLQRSSESRVLPLSLFSVYWLYFYLYYFKLYVSGVNFENFWHQ